MTGQPLAPCLLDADQRPRLGMDYYQNLVLWVVPAGETRQVWLDVSSHELRAGRYELRLDVQPLNAPKRCLAQEVRVEVAVLPLVLPRDHPLSVFTFEYGGDYRGEGEDQDMPAHYVNWYHNCAER